MSTAIQVTLDAQAIEAQVTQAILDAALGAKIKDAIEKSIKQFNIDSYFDNALRTIVEQQMKSAIADMVREKYSDVVLQKVHEKFDDAFMHDVITALVSRLGR